MYVITNGLNYLMYNVVNQLVSTTDIDKAVHFRDKAKADNVVVNLPKSMKHLGYYSHLIVREDEPVEVEKLSGENREDDFKKSPDVELVDGFPAIEEVIDKIVEFEDWLENLQNRKEAIEGVLSYTERECEDIIHAIEFFNCSASEGYKLYKQFHEVRKNRRRAKDSLLILEILNDAFGDIERKTSGRLKGILKRKYSPRIFPELFIDKK